MKNPFHFEYPDENPLTTAKPESFPCPVCAVYIEIWTDEDGKKCPSCNTYLKKAQLMKTSNVKPVDEIKVNEKLKRIMQHALKEGASDIKILATQDIRVDNSLADKCREPGCENYGLSRSCPPHVSGPSAFKKDLEKYSWALFFKIDVPSEILYSNEGREIFQLLHEIAAGIEKSAVKMGFMNAQAYAGGSCKKIFCYEHSECLALAENGKCRNPEYARPSMSGFGIDVSELFKISGWTLRWDTHDDETGKTGMANVCGLVLIC